MHQDRTTYLKDLSLLATTYRRKLNDVMTKIGWSYQSLSHEHPEIKLEQDASKDVACPEGSFKDKTPLDIGPGESLNLLETIRSPYFSPGSNEQGTSSDKLYNELLAGLSSSTTTKKVKEKTEEERLTEMLEKERNAKRRRVNYKNKIHTKNKSTTEVLRELVKQQMDFLMESALDAAPVPPSTSQTETVQDQFDQELIPVSFSGNPHLVWQKVGFLSGLNRKSESRDLDKKRNRPRSKSPESDTARHRKIRRNEKESRESPRSRGRHRDQDESDRRRRDFNEGSHYSHRRDRSRSSHRSHKNKREKLRRDDGKESEDSLKSDEHKRKRKDKERKHRHSRKHKKRSRDRD